MKRAGAPTRPLARALTRDGRDTLFLLATIAAVLLPHADHLPPWAVAITVAILAWRALLACSQQPLPGRLLLVLVLVAVGALTWSTYRTLLGREAGITMLAMLLALKTLELRARRDAFVVFFLGFFLVLTQFVYSQSLLTAVWMLVAVWALLSALVLAQMPVGQPSLALAAGHAARTTLYGLPVMILLFLLFPRIAPLWGLPSESVGRTGLSNQLDFGVMSEIANNDGIALRLRFGADLQGAPPPPDARYFRGPVLGRFDGRSWRPAPAVPGRISIDALQLDGPPLHYELTMEPLRIGVLPLLEMSPGQPGAELALDGIALQRGAELQWLAPRLITERLRLHAEAYTRYAAGAGRSRASLQPFLELPAGLNPRSLAWAAALRREPRYDALDEAARAPALAAAVLAHIRSADFGYTLAPGRYGESSPHLIDEFWFDRRLGFCEHFAAAFVVVMRAMGVPARIVTGFQGMDAQPQDGYWIVRNSNAHAWAEYWVAGRGWQRADPTAAIAPERVEQGLALRPQSVGLAGALERLGPALWSRLQRGWEGLNNRWQQLVLNYSRHQQFELLKGLGFERADWLALGRLSAAVIAALALAGGAWTLWQARPHDAWSRQRQRVLRELRALDVEASAHEAPSRWGARLTQRYGAAAEPAVQLLLALERSRYAGDTAPMDPRLRRRWLRSFRAAGRMLRASTA
jgi:transglutaminase-like putative cysteine protease